MADTFLDINGESHDVDDYDGVVCSKDILTGIVTKYYATYDGEKCVEISEDYYDALKKHYKN